MFAEIFVAHSPNFDSCSEFEISFVFDEDQALYLNMSFLRHQILRLLSSGTLHLVVCSMRTTVFVTFCCYNSSDKGSKSFRKFSSLSVFWSPKKVGIFFFWHIFVALTSTRSWIWFFLSVCSEQTQVKRNFFFHGSKAPSVPGSPHYRDFTIRLRNSTLGRTPLGEAETSTWQHSTLTRRRHLCPRAGFGPAILASERSQTHALDRAATMGSARRNKM
jgi:hypothetical protein